MTGAILTGASYPSLDNVSCGAPGDCTATGSYTDADNQLHVFLVTETSGAWSAATAIDESDLGVKLPKTQDQSKA